MRYTTHGFMTSLDMADHQQLHDNHQHPDCPGHEEGVGLVFCRAVEDCPGDGWDPEAGAGAPDANRHASQTGGISS